jgi:hypothetical protein
VLVHRRGLQPEPALRRQLDRMPQETILGRAQILHPVPSWAAALIDNGLVGGDYWREQPFTPAMRVRACASADCF